MNSMAEGGIVTGLGILVVFVCLALIILVITVLSWILKDRTRKKPEPAVEKKIEEEIHKPMPEIPVVQVEQNELVAVLTAAVAAYLEEESPSGLVVRSFKRVPGANAWGRAGRSAQIYNKF